LAFCESQTLEDVNQDRQWSAGQGGGRQRVRGRQNTPSLGEREQGLLSEKTDRVVSRTRMMLLKLAQVQRTFLAVMS
jgi:hypothetical protein